MSLTFRTTIINMAPDTSEHPYIEIPHSLIMRSIHLKRKQEEVMIGLRSGDDLSKYAYFLDEVRRIRCMLELAKKSVEQDNPLPVKT